jgi:glycosyltransferase involved in cell wall biosynthesis
MSHARVVGVTLADEARRQPLVSIVMIAFNVERYVAQAIESVLAQHPPLDIEIIIGEDGSTDRTREIVQAYARTYPKLVRLLLRDQNLGMNRNFFATWAEARGRYVALLDGDDYWTGPDKLQMQVAYLERNPCCALCFHNVTVVYEDDTPAHPFHLERPGPRLSTRIPATSSGLRELAGGNFIQTASVMYRRGLVTTLPSWVLEMPTFDWPLHLLHAEHGTVDYCDRTLAAYRVHADGMWSSGLSYYRTTDDVDSIIRAFTLVDAHLCGRYRAEMAAPLSFLLQQGMRVAARNRDHEAVFGYARAFLAYALRQRDLRGASAAMAAFAKASAAQIFHSRPAGSSHRSAGQGQ